MSLSQMNSRMAIMMGGRIAEELIFGKDKVTSGASSDIQQATKLARAMVTQWGLSDELGPLAYGDNQQEVFLGHSVAQTQSVSEETAKKIDAEVRRIVEEGYEWARKILTEKADDLEALAQGLLEYETLSGEEINDLLQGKKPHRPTEDDMPPSDEPTASVPTAGKSSDSGFGGGIDPEPQGT